MSKYLLELEKLEKDALDLSDPIGTYDHLLNIHLAEYMGGGADALPTQLPFKGVDGKYTNLGANHLKVDLAENELAADQLMASLIHSLQFPLRLVEEIPESELGFTVQDMLNDVMKTIKGDISGQDIRDSDFFKDYAELKGISPDELFELFEKAVMSGQPTIDLSEKLGHGELETEKVHLEIESKILENGWPETVAVITIKDFTPQQLDNFKQMATGQYGIAIIDGELRLNITANIEPQEMISMLAEWEIIPEEMIPELEAKWGEISYKDPELFNQQDNHLNNQNLRRQMEEIAGINPSIPDVAPTTLMVGEGGLPEPAAIDIAHLTLMVGEGGLPEPIAVTDPSMLTDALNEYGEPNLINIDYYEDPSYYEDTGLNGAGAYAGMLPSAFQDANNNNGPHSLETIAKTPELSSSALDTNNNAAGLDGEKMESAVNLDRFTV